MMNVPKSGQKVNTVASRKSKEHPTGSGNSCSDRSDDQDSSEDGKSNSADAKEEICDDSKKNSSRGGAKDPSQSVRAKNREHAKNTRLRKKNYIETLKDNIKEVSNVRDNRDKDKKSALGKMADQNTLRKKSISTFFINRNNVDTSLDAWNAILASDFICVLPITPYQSFPPHQVIDGRRQLMGAAGMVYDTLSMYAMLYSAYKLRIDSSANHPKVKVIFEALQDSGIMQDTRYMCRWTMRTEGLIAQGAPFELTQSGMLAAEFVPDRAKLRHMEMTMDVMSFMQQLRRSTGRDIFQAVPNAAFPLELSADHLLNNNSIYPYNVINGNSLETNADATTNPNNTVDMDDPTINHNNTTNVSVLSTNENGVFRHPAVSTGILATNNNMLGFSREGAMEAFLGKAEARAVIGAAEPYLLLFSNQRFQAMFQTKGLSFTDCYFPLFSSLVRASENSVTAVNHIVYYLQSGFPCNGILHCAPASSNGAPQPSLRCLCTFYPLFAGGSVQQFLVSFDLLDPASPVASTANSMSHAMSASENDRLNQVAQNGHQEKTETGGNSSDHSSDVSATANGNSKPAYEVNYQSLRQHNTKHKANANKGSIPVSNNTSSNNLPRTAQSATTSNTSAGDGNAVRSAEKSTSKSRAPRSRSSQSSSTSHEPTTSSSAPSRYVHSHSTSSNASGGDAMSHSNSVDGHSVQSNAYRNPHDGGLNGAELYSMLSGGISGRLPDLPVVSSGSGSSNTASKSGSNTGSGNSGDNSGEESGMTSSPLQIEDFAHLVDTPSPLDTPPCTDDQAGADEKNDVKNNLLDLNAANLSNNGTRSSLNNVNGKTNQASSVSQFRSLETDTNLTDLDIDEKFFDEF